MDYLKPEIEVVELISEPIANDGQPGLGSESTPF